jgi:hypothetical protein
MTRQWSVADLAVILNPYWVRWPALDSEFPQAIRGQFTNSVTNGTYALTMPYPFPSNLAQPGVQDFVSTTPEAYHDPYVYQWNVTLDRDLEATSDLG